MSSTDWESERRDIRARYELHIQEFKRAVKREDLEGQRRHWAASEKAWNDLQAHRAKKPRK